MNYKQILFLIAVLGLVGTVSADDYVCAAPVTRTLYPTNDGTMYETTPDAIFPTLRNGAGDSVSNNPGDYLYNWVPATATTDIYNYHSRSGITWDTSLLTKWATVNNASVSVRGVGKYNANGVVDYELINFTPLSPTTYVATDYARTGFVELANNVTYASYSTSAYTTQYLNSIGISIINVTGYTTVMIDNSASVYNSNLTWAAGLGISGMRMRPRGYLYGNFQPYMTVNYTECANISPVAGFTIVKNPVDAYEMANFNDTSSNSPTRWNWSWGDSTWSNFTINNLSFPWEENITHFYNSPGTYSVYVIASNEAGSNQSGTQTITVIDATVVADFTSNKTSGNTPLSVGFTDTSSGNNLTTWQWTFGDYNLNDYMDRWEFDFINVTNHSLSLNTSGFPALLHYEGSISEFGKFNQSLNDIGTALSFVNIVSGTNGLDVGLSDRSYSTWVKLRGAAKTGTIVFSGASSGSGSPGVWAYTSSNTSILVYFSDGATARVQKTFTTPALFTDTWHHIVISADRDVGLSLYVDNNLSSSGLLDISTQTGYMNDNAPSIGGLVSFGPDIYTLNGLIDDFRIYNRALNASEVNALYKMGDQNPNYIYRNNGTYNVSLTTCNFGLCNSTTKANYITCPDTQPPASITNLANITTTCEQINWTWTNPTDADYNGTMIWKDGTWLKNTTSTTTFDLWTGLTGGTAYTFSSRTFDNATPPNVKTTFVNMTATPTACTLAPVASFTSNRTCVIASGNIQFNDTSTGTNITNWSWMFGDSNTSFETNPNNTYSTVGMFTVNHSVTNSAGIAWSNISNYITVRPIGDSCAATGSNLQFIVQGTSGIAWASSFILAGAGFGIILLGKRPKKRNGNDDEYGGGG